MIIAHVIERHRELDGIASCKIELQKKKWM
jgi:hypothetical protein